MIENCSGKLHQAKSARHRCRHDTRATSTVCDARGGQQRYRDANRGGGDQVGLAEAKQTCCVKCETGWGRCCSACPARNNRQLSLGNPGRLPSAQPMKMVGTLRFARSCHPRSNAPETCRSSAHHGDDNVWHYRRQSNLLPVLLDKTDRRHFHPEVRVRQTSFDAGARGRVFGIDPRIVDGVHPVEIANMRQEDIHREKL